MTRPHGDFLLLLAFVLLFAGCCPFLDIEAPRITLNGEATMTLQVGEAFVDPGATASDNCDGDITDQIVIGGDAVDTSTPGTYIITYNVRDNAGNAAPEVTRTVIVETTTGGGTSVNLSDGTGFVLEASVDATCSEVTDTTGLPPGALCPPVMIEGTMPAGGTAVLSFTSTQVFSSDSRVAYLDTDWVPVPSTVSLDGTTISATVDHFSVWTVIEVTGGSVAATIRGTVTFDIAPAWVADHGSSLYDPVERVLFVSLAADPDDPATPELNGAAPMDWYSSSVWFSGTTFTAVDYTLDLTGVPAGSYIAFALIDMDGDGEPDADDLHGVYAGGPKTIDDTTGELNDIDIEVRTVSVSGQITLATALADRDSVASKDIVVQLMRDDQFDEPMAAHRYTSPATPSSLGTLAGADAAIGYTVGAVPCGWLFATAFADVDGNGVFARHGGEPFGVWSENLTAEDYVVLDQNRTDVDVEISFWPPAVEVTMPADGEMVQGLQFPITGTVTDVDQSAIGDGIVLVGVFSADNIAATVSPPQVIDWDAYLFAEEVVLPAGWPKPWATSDVDFSLAGPDDYYVFAQVYDDLGLSWYVLTPFSVEPEPPFLNATEVLGVGSTGTFDMGSESDDAWPNESPVHSVTLTRPFAIGTYEVTNAQAAEVFNLALDYGAATATASVLQNAIGDAQDLLEIGSSDCDISLVGGELVIDAGQENFPVQELSWCGAVAFCYYLNEIEELEQTYDLADWSCNFTATGWRLPTEAEWAYAARGGASSAGYTYSGGNILGDVAWYGGNSGSESHEVGTKHPNELGIYDMTGNALEWCWDRYAFAYYASSPAFDPEGPESGADRVSRGGSSGHSDEAYLRIAKRFYAPPAFLHYSQGARVARTLD